MADPDEVRAHIEHGRRLLSGAFPPVALILGAYLLCTDYAFAILGFFGKRLHRRLRQLWRAMYLWANLAIACALLYSARRKLTSCQHAQRRLEAAQDDDDGDEYAGGGGGRFGLQCLPTHRAPQRAVLLQRAGNRGLAKTARAEQARQLEQEADPVALARLCSALVPA